MFVKVALSELVFPTRTFPKLKLGGVAVKVVVAAAPVPLRVIVIGEFGALLVTVMLPVALPVDAGEKPALNVVFFPALIVIGMLSPVMLNPVPVTLA